MNSKHIQVDCYGPDEFDVIPWPNTGQADFARRYFKPFYDRGTKDLISNVDTDVHIAIVEGIVVPYTVGSRGDNNSYVCAPQSHYVDYGCEELRHFKGSFLYYLALIIIPILRFFCNICQFNKVVMVNNWLLSTNLYPDISQEQIKALADSLKSRYPKYAIVFRSIDLGLREHLYRVLEEHGSRMVFSRRVHIVHRDNKKVWKRSVIKRDNRLFKKSPYVLVSGEDLKEDDFERLADLYKQLYIGKYSHLNPQFTAEFMRHKWKENLWEFSGYRIDDTFDAVVGTIHINGVGTAPVIGYEFDRPRKSGLYRLAYLEMLRSTQRRDETMHCSAGVAHYKQLRSAESYLEYNAVFDSHLPPQRKLPWWVFQQLSDKVIVPKMIEKNL